MAALRNVILTGSAGRQALLDKRRFEAVEKVWTAVNDLAALKGLAASMAVLNYKAIAKEANDPKMQQFLSMVGGSAPDIQTLKDIARDEQPYLPELAWAYFSSYKTILHLSYHRLSLLKMGDIDADKFFNIDGIRKLLKAALPHRSNFIDEHEPESYYYLLDEIQGNLLAELRKILEGKEADRDATERAKEIMSTVKSVVAEEAKQVNSEGAAVQS